jgi:hypothetical protein
MMAGARRDEQEAKEAVWPSRLSPHTAQVWRKGYPGSTGQGDGHAEMNALAEFIRKVGKTGLRPLMMLAKCRWIAD